MAKHLICHPRLYRDNGDDVRLYPEENKHARIPGRYVVSLVMLTVCLGRAPSDSFHLIPVLANISIFFI
jgi:hypothetical protein